MCSPKTLLCNFDERKTIKREIKNRAHVQKNAFGWNMHKQMLIYPSAISYTNIFSLWLYKAEFATQTKNGGWRQKLDVSSYEICFRSEQWIDVMPKLFSETVQKTCKLQMKKQHQQNIIP